MMMCWIFKKKWNAKVDGNCHDSPEGGGDNNSAITSSDKSHPPRTVRRLFPRLQRALFPPRSPHKLHRHQSLVRPKVLTTAGALHCCWGSATTSATSHKRPETAGCSLAPLHGVIFLPSHKGKKKKNKIVKFFSKKFFGLNSFLPLLFPFCFFFVFVRLFEKLRQNCIASASPLIKARVTMLKQSRSRRYVVYVMGVLYCKIFSWGVRSGFFERSEKWACNCEQSGGRKPWVAASCDLFCVWVSKVL